jgi:hypothetical protein
VLAAFTEALQQGASSASRFPRLEPGSDFFAAGGDSLAAAAAAQGLGIAPALVAAHPTARRLAHHLAGAAAAGSGTASLLEFCG